MAQPSLAFLSSRSYFIGHSFQGESMPRLRLARLAGAMLGCLTVACTTASSPDTRARDEAAIRAADSSFSAVATAKNLDQVVGYYAADATLLPPNSPMLTSTDAIRKLFGDMMAAPGFAIGWQAIKA